MKVSEEHLRSVYRWARDQSELVITTVNKFDGLNFLADDPALKASTLRGREHGTNGALAIFLTPGGQRLKIVADYASGLKVTQEFKLPKAFRPPLSH